jgi:hypothetical protein
MTTGQAQLFSRRQFLRRSVLAAGAALAAPALVPRSVFGGSGALPPCERINMGFIGLGNQGTGHLLGGGWTYVAGGYAARADVQVLAVCDVRQQRRESAQQRCNQAYAQRLGRPGYNGVTAYNDFREVLARPDIDAVLLAVPYHWAAPMATMAVRAGKDVYCEKPIAVILPALRAHLPGRHAAALGIQPPLPAGLRTGAQRADWQAEGSLCVSFAGVLLSHGVDVRCLQAGAEGF